MFTPVVVASGDFYTYSDWSESSVTTKSGTICQHRRQLTYQWLGNQSASSSWQSIAESFIVPTVSAETVFHVFNANGQLIIDDTSLVQDIPCTPTLINGLANGNFEQTCGTIPTLRPLNPNYGSDPVVYGYRVNL